MIQWSEGQNGLGLASSPSHADSSSEKLEEGPQLSSPLRKEFSKGTNTVKEIKAFIRSRARVKKTHGQTQSELHAIGVA